MDVSRTAPSATELASLPDVALGVAARALGAASGRGDAVLASGGRGVGMTGEPVPSERTPVDMNTVLGKVVSVLFAFRADDHGVTLAELGRRTGLPKGTLHRIVSDLLQVRLLDRIDGGYRLSVQLFQLGMRASV